MYVFAPVSWSVSLCVGAYVCVCARICAYICVYAYPTRETCCLNMLSQSWPRLCVSVSAFLSVCRCVCVCVCRSVSACERVEACGPLFALKRCRLPLQDAFVKAGQLFPQFSAEGHQQSGPTMKGLEFTLAKWIGPLALSSCSSQMVAPEAMTQPARLLESLG